MDDAERDLLLAQVREVYGRACYTHKTHEKQADISSALYRQQRQIRVWLTAASSGVFLASLFGVVLDAQWAALATSFVAVLLSASTLAGKDFKHGEETQQHRDTAAALWSIRESYLSLIVDLTGGAIDLGAARETRDRLQESAADILREAPRTTPKAYRLAQQGLQLNEDLTFTEQEIDYLLPAKLRTAKAGGAHVADR
ncbi:SLATT domain-containing protein [Microbacterium sp. NPDC064584]|uniref:SLATT domain-containing protein n=1 Tax=Microbacterium sp. NPDC064584 TaxID=3155817 RepID=UPI00341749F3